MSLFIKIILSNVEKKVVKLYKIQVLTNLFPILSKLTMWEGFYILEADVTRCQTLE